MTSVKSSARVTLALIVAAVAAVAMLPGPARAQTDKLVVAIGTAPPDLSLQTYYFALENGFYKQEGLDVTLVPFNGDATAMPRDGLRRCRHRRGRRSRNPAQGHRGRLQAEDLSRDVAEDGLSAGRAEGHRQHQAVRGQDDRHLRPWRSLVPGSTAHDQVGRRRSDQREVHQRRRKLGADARTHWQEDRRGSAEQLVRLAHNQVRLPACHRRCRQRSARISSTPSKWPPSGRSRKSSDALQAFAIGNADAARSGRSTTPRRQWRSARRFFRMSPKDEIAAGLTHFAKIQLLQRRAGLLSKESWDFTVDELVKGRRAQAGAEIRTTTSCRSSPRPQRGSSAPSARRAGSVGFDERRDDA